MKYSGLAYDKDGKASLPLQTLNILAEGGFVSSDDMDMLRINNDSQEMEEFSKDTKASKITRPLAGVGAAAAAVGGVVLAPFTGGASLAVAAPIVAGLGKHALAGKPQLGQDSNPWKDLGLSAIGAGIGAASAAASSEFGGGNTEIPLPAELKTPNLPTISTGPAAATVPKNDVRFSNGGQLYGNGGSTVFTKSKLDNGLVVLKGKPHEEGGIDLRQGIEVEGYETIFNDFVYTNRHVITEDTAKLHNLPTGSIGRTFAQASKNYAKYFDERPNDPYAREEFEENMGRLEKAHLHAVPQSRPENIGVETMNAGLQGFGPQAANGGKIVYYINSIPFADGGDTGDTTNTTDIIDRDTSDIAYAALERVLQAQFGDPIIRLPNTPTQHEGGQPGLRMYQYEMLAGDMQRIRNMPDLEKRNRAIGDIWNSLSQSNIFKTENLNDDDLQVLDRVGYAYPRIERQNTASPTEPPQSPQTRITSAPEAKVLPKEIIDLIPEDSDILAGINNLGSELVNPAGGKNLQEPTVVLNSKSNPQLPIDAPAMVPQGNPYAGIDFLSDSNALGMPFGTKDLESATGETAGAIAKAHEKPAPPREPYKFDPKHLRYAPLVGNAIDLGITAFSKPDMILPNDFLITDDYRKQNIDKELLQREADQQTADLTYGLSNDATSQSALMSGLASISAGTAKAKTDAVMKGQLFDAEQGQMFEQFERQKDTTNAQTKLQVQNMNDANSAAWSDNLSDSITAMTQNIGAVGTDQFNKWVADNLFAYDSKGNYVNPSKAGMQYMAQLLNQLDDEQLSNMNLSRTTKKKSQASE